MKRKLLVIVLALTFALTACGNKQVNTTEESTAEAPVLTESTEVTEKTKESSSSSKESKESKESLESKEAVKETKASSESVKETESSKSSESAEKSKTTESKKESEGKKESQAEVSSKTAETSKESEKNNTSKTESSSTGSSASGATEESSAVPSAAPAPEPAPAPSQPVHTHTMTTVTTPATCGTAGHTKTYCTSCSYVETDADIPATGQHNFVGDPVADRAPSNCQDGVATYNYCSGCGMPNYCGMIYGDHVSATRTVREASCTLQGKEEEYCSVCGITLGYYETGFGGHGGDVDGDGVCEECGDYMNP